MDLQASVIIPTFNDWDSLQTCLDCLAVQTIGPEAFEIIVANNNPQPESPASLRLPVNARVIHAPKPGSYAARNVAIRQAKAKVLFFTDSDCQPDSRWVEAGLQAIAPLDPHARVAGSIKLFPKGKTWTTIELCDRVHHLNQEEYVQDGWSVTANLIVRRDAFDLVGLFNDDRFSGSDREWSDRATGLGCWLVYDPATQVRHPARADFAEMRKKRVRLIGGAHTAEQMGLIAVYPLRKHLMFLDEWDVRRTMSDPDLTDVERVKVLLVSIRLRVSEFAEVVRLRYLGGTPKRS